MVELRDLLQSKELKDAVEAIEFLLLKQQQQRKMPHQRSFRSLYTARKFPAAEILRILVDPDPGYPGQKGVLANGFIGWALHPENRTLRKDLMAYAALEHMAEAEEEAHDELGHIDLPRDILARYVLTGADFLSEVYSVIGGYEGFKHTNDLRVMSILLSEDEKAIRTTVRALTYLHHGADDFLDPEYDYAPSLNRAVGIFDALKSSKSKYPFKDRYVARSLLHKRWSGTKDTLALVYAASTVRVNRKSILDLMLNASFIYQEHLEYFPQWFRRARYVSDHVFSKMSDQGIYRQTSKLLEGISAEPFKAPTLEATEMQMVETMFRRKYRSSTR